MSQQGRRRYPSTRGGIRPTLYSWNQKTRDRAERWTTVETPAADPVGDGPDPGLSRSPTTRGCSRCARSLIAEDPEMSVVGTGGDAEQAIAIAGRNIRTRALGCPHAQRRRARDAREYQTREPRDRAHRAVRRRRRKGSRRDAPSRRRSYLVKGDGGGSENRGCDPSLRPWPGWPDPPGRARAAVIRRASVPES